MTPFGVIFIVVLFSLALIAAKKDWLVKFDLWLAERKPKEYPINDRKEGRRK